MEKFTVHKPDGPISGIVDLPRSKSVSNRVLIIRALCDEPFFIRNLSEADDTRILQDLIEYPSPEEDCGAGGTTFRFLLALRALQGRPVLLTGSDRLRQRPVVPLLEALRSLGADITCPAGEGHPPLLIGKGRLKGGFVSIPANISSQFISALLLVAPYMDNDLELELTGPPVSLSYIDMTIALMKHFGASVERMGHRVHVRKGSYRPQDFNVPVDWSAAAYFYALTALLPGTKLALRNASGVSYQGDEVIAYWMEQWGVSTSVEGDDLIIEGSGIPSRTFEYDLINQPDLAQPLAVLAAVAGRKIHLTGLSTLPNKETDRLMALKTELERTGAKVYTGSDFLVVEGVSSPEKIMKLQFPSYRDHRMVMSMSLLTATGANVTLLEPDEVSKSFPSYFEALQKLGFEIS